LIGGKHGIQTITVTASDLSGQVVSEVKGKMINPDKAGAYFPLQTITLSRPLSTDDFAMAMIHTMYHSVLQFIHHASHCDLNKPEIISAEIKI
jgi:hypothetical protein